MLWTRLASLKVIVKTTTWSDCRDNLASRRRLPGLVRAGRAAQGAGKNRAESTKRH